MFSRYRIDHFEDFTFVPPVSIDSGKTHQKLPAHSLVFRGFFCEMCLADFPDWLHYHLPPPPPSSLYCTVQIFSINPRPACHKTEKGEEGDTDRTVKGCHHARIARGNPLYLLTRQVEGGAEERAPPPPSPHPQTYHFDQFEAAAVVLSY